MLFYEFNKQHLLGLLPQSNAIAAYSHVRIHCATINHKYNPRSVKGLH